MKDVSIENLHKKKGKGPRGILTKQSQNEGGVPEGRAPLVLHYSMPLRGILNLGSPRKIDFQNKFKHRNQNNISI